MVLYNSLSFLSLHLHFVGKMEELEGCNLFTNRNCLSQFPEIPWNQTTDVHRGSTLIKQMIR